ncbi:P-loop NTPase [Candidatus Nitrospira allomarina]|uniref:P-loop NTPase n=1 Tax=Candidatus Nitrospira allomarina TaxID=3020900 RepID=A0AA96GBP4_9BACT|nr:P-loop NTPase [Candidatus Nitrospira allomarina]WNM58427.1 P-loop NTPase [Candidatus Nitrospira allomarina]
MPCIVSVASGKGGVGKSMVVSNLGLLLARKGLRVTLVDMDIGGANLHILFGMFHPPSTLTDFLTNTLTNLNETAHPIPSLSSLKLISGTGETLITANLQHAKKKRLIRHIQKLDADIILVDVGAGTSYHALDFYLLADYYLAVATPDPTSVLDLYRFIKLAAIRKVLTAFLARDPVADALLDKDFHSVTAVLEAVGRTNESGVEIAQEALKRFQPALILNRMTSKSRVNTLHLQHLLKQYVGTDLSILGNIPEDMHVQQSILKYLPVVELAPTSPATIALNQIADNVLEMVGRTAGPIGRVEEPRKIRA